MGRLAPHHENVWALKLHCGRYTPHLPVVNALNAPGTRIAQQLCNLSYAPKAVNQGSIGFETRESLFHTIIKHYV